MAIYASLLFAMTVASAGPMCEALDADGNAAGNRVPGHLAVREVIGQGRVQFYSGPSEACAMRGIFVVARDRVVAYVDYEGFTSVMFLNAKTHTDALGWVRTSRLRETGTGISPE